ncbi:efflux RND transporter periplasmic adaptor subunit [Actinoallomurus soli]|uniref:efflux RND transporter periplasmic adaptor subunit n=1 Tax=Actinoallomurus soli TaxID=2952535 RepID=UPI0020926824|nr:peptidoglycan-binding protein [Actinoallomurus soli]MCO5973772.1 peptidoglycan-binding protein [Actinoallomurus soli]
MPQRRGRAWVWSMAVAVAVAVAASVVVRSGGGAAQEAEHKRVPNTALVERRTLRETVTAPGSLGYSRAGELSAGRAGIITRLPRAGSQVKLGGALYSVDNRPVQLLRGHTPMWRTLTSGMSDGPDVRQLEQSLATLGYFTGAPDAHFNWTTNAAIRRWQDACKVKETGTIPLGQIVFAPDDVRVAQTVAHLGDRVAAGTAVLKLSSLRKVVSAQLKSANQAVAKVGGDVTVDLPSGKTTTGTISRVGVPEQVDQNSGKTVVVPVTITLDHPSDAGSLQEASVLVDFPTASRKNVLTVPVSALIALPGSGYGVEVVRDAATTETIKVEPGLFAGGFVEVTGDRLTAGQKVVVPTL